MLGCPASVGVRGAACEVHAPTVELEEEEHIEASEPERVDGKEIAGNDRLRVSGQELAPAELGASARRGHACLSEDLGDRRCRDTYAHTGELADDPLATPARVLPRQPQHQLTDLLGDRRSTRAPSGQSRTIASRQLSTAREGRSMKVPKCPEGGRKTASLSATGMLARMMPNLATSVS